MEQFSVLHVWLLNGLQSMPDVDLLYTLFEHSACQAEGITMTHSLYIKIIQNLMNIYTDVKRNLSLLH